MPKDSKVVALYTVNASALENDRKLLRRNIDVFSIAGVTQQEMTAFAGVLSGIRVHSLSFSVDRRFSMCLCRPIPFFQEADACRIPPIVGEPHDGP